MFGGFEYSRICPDDQRPSLDCINIWVFIHNYAWTLQFMCNSIRKYTEWCHLCIYKCVYTKCFPYSGILSIYSVHTALHAAPRSTHCTLHCTQHYTTLCTLHCTQHYTLHITKIPCNLYYTNLQLTNSLRYTPDNTLPYPLLT